TPISERVSQCSQNASDSYIRESTSVQSECIRLLYQKEYPSTVRLLYQREYPSVVRVRQTPISERVPQRSQNASDSYIRKSIPAQSDSYIRESTPAQSECIRLLYQAEYTSAVRVRQTPISERVP
ncbi:Hypothetical predicted protein, partial [Pelobates cultripes]